ncbi:hypothetical protein PUN28_006734 [Cardiocondyla obscurior]|uniref:Uncharacterized protein n=1 Tax=Cardiocondyla obscurior TaxID=286306 RepID=A0AAW2G154_9HYME
MFKYKTRCNLLINSILSCLADLKWVLHYRLPLFLRLCIIHKSNSCYIIACIMRRLIRRDVIANVRASPDDFLSETEVPANLPLNYIYIHIYLDLYIKKRKINHTQFSTSLNPKVAQL